MTGERVDVEAVRADLAKYVEAFNRFGLPNDEWCSEVAGSAIDVTQHVEPLLAALAVAEQRATTAEHEANQLIEDREAFVQSLCVALEASYESPEMGGPRRATPADCVRWAGEERTFRKNWQGRAGAAEAKIAAALAEHKRVPIYFIADDCIAPQAHEDRWVEGEYMNDMLCPICEPHGWACGECGTPDPDEPASWPCSTVAALSDPDTQGGQQ